MTNIDAANYIDELLNVIKQQSSQYAHQLAVANATIKELEARLKSLSGDADSE